jgi:hypothetical protein
VGIEILDVLFVKVRHWTGFVLTLSLETLTILLQGGTAHRAPGLGRQNRKQRLGEYAAERGAVLGFVASAAASGAVGGRTKRARGVGVGGSGARDSDETDEDTDSEEIEDEEEDMDVDALAARVTIVFEGGRNGAIPGYDLSPLSPVVCAYPHVLLLTTIFFCECRFKYEPDALRAAAFHPRLLVPSALVGSVSPRARKRQRVDEGEGGEDAMDVEVDSASPVGSPPVWRGVELETAVERFLLRMYDAGAGDADAVAETGANAASEDTEGGAEKIKPSSPEDKQEAEGDRRRWEIWLLGTLDQNDGSPRLLPPPGVADMDGNGNAAAKTGGAVLLQRGLRASNLEFVEGEVRVLQDASPLSAVDSESSSAAREGWAMEVRRWRCART